jgi:heptosyltransferase-2
VAPLFEQHPVVDRIFIYEDPGIHRGVVGLGRLIRDLAACGFDMAFLLQNAFEAACISALAGIPERVGYASDARGMLLTRALPYHPSLIHQRDFYVRLLALVG